MSGATPWSRRTTPPFLLTVGNRDATTHGVNVIGLERKQFPATSIQALRAAYRPLFRAGLTLEEAMQRVRAEMGAEADVMELVDFMAASKRGVIR